MANVVEWKTVAKRLFGKAQRSYSAANSVARKTKRIAVLGAYWGAVVSVGVIIAVVILQVNHVPMAEPAYAGAGSWVGTLLGTLLYYTIIGPIGLCAIIVAYIMQLVINYPFGSIWSSAGVNGGFVNVSAVQTGWKLVRDVCNMFFSLILVIIALATVLKIESYSWQKMLPKLILMAVLINFSKTICGVFTDFATVTMATFGGSFGSTFAGGVIGAFGLSSLGGLSQDPSSSTQNDSSLTSVILAYIAASLMTMIFFVIMLSFTVTLLFRIVMLWFLIVLSPMAYITRILPQTAKYSSQWWEMFGRYVTVGPLVTFFLWLSLTMAFGTEVGAGSSSGNPIGVGFSSTEGTSALANTGYAPPNSGAFNATSPNVLANFLIATMLLMASLQLMHKMAAEAGKLTGAVEGMAWGAGAALMTMPGQLMQTFGYGIGSQTKIGADGKPTSANPLSRLGFWASHRATRDKDGNITGYELGALAKTATFLGSTVFQPTDWAKGVAKGRKESYEDKKHLAQKRGEEKLHEMRSEAISGQGAKNLLGVMSRVAGVIGGAGLDPKQVADEYLSGGGILRMAGAFTRRNYDANAKVLEEDAKKTKDELRKENNKIKAEEADAVVKDVQDRRAAIADLNTAQSAITAGSPGFGLNRDYKEIEGALQKHLQDLQSQMQAARDVGNDTHADALELQHQYLKEAIDRGNPITMGDLETMYRGDSNVADIRTLMANAYKDRGTNLQKSVDSVTARLTESGWNGQFGAAAAFTSLATDESRKALQDKLKDVTQQASALRTTAATYREGESYEARKHSEHLIADELSKIKGIKNTEELMVYLQRAQREKNQYMYEAVVKRIAQNADFNEIIQQQMADEGFDGKDGRPEASSDADGLELWRKEVLMKKLGMGEHESLRLANDLSYIEEDVGHLGAARAYSVVNGHLHFNKNAARSKMVANEWRKADINQKLKLNRLAWGKENSRRQFELSELGMQLLLSDGDAMAEQRKWENMGSNAKLNLSRPESIAQMRARGVSSKLIGLLEDYWRDVGQYEAPGQSVERGLSRFATYQEEEHDDDHGH